MDDDDKLPMVRFDDDAILIDKRIWHIMTPEQKIELASNLGSLEQFKAFCERHGLTRMVQ